MALTGLFAFQEKPPAIAHHFALYYPRSDSRIPKNPDFAYLQCHVIVLERSGFGARDAHSMWCSAIALRL